MRHTIYQITNLLNGKIYIGKHQTKNPNDSYYGSGKAIVNSILKYGREHFKKTILFDFDSEDEMNLKEKELINEDFVNREDTYNLGIGGEGGPHFKGRKHSQESIDKGRTTKKLNGYTASEETRRKISHANKNRIVSEECKRKLRLRALIRHGKTSEEAQHIISTNYQPKVKLNRSEAQKEYYKNPENRKKKSDECKKLHLEYDMDEIFKDFNSGTKPKKIMEKYSMSKTRYDHIRKEYLIPLKIKRGVTVDR